MHEFNIHLSQVGQTIGVCGLPAPTIGVWQTTKSDRLPHYLLSGHTFDMFYRRRLPHWIPEDAIIFLSWRLAGSVPVSPPEIITLDYLSGKWESPVVASGPFWLRDPRIARLVSDALRHGETTRRFYDLYAWVIMPNHVHVLLKPRMELLSIMRWLKGRTGRMANRLLGRAGMPFWQDESFDHWVRSSHELQGLIEYVENNPVNAGLVQAANDWLWSSAGFQADDKKRSSAPQMLRV